MIHHTVPPCDKNVTLSNILYMSLLQPTQPQGYLPMATDLTLITDLT